MTGLGDHTSCIQRFRTEEGFPPFVEIRTAAGELKITKTAFREALNQLLAVLQANDLQPA